VLVEPAGRVTARWGRRNETIAAFCFHLNECLANWIALGIECQFIEVIFGSGKSKFLTDTEPTAAIVDMKPRTWSLHANQPIYQPRCLLLYNINPGLRQLRRVDVDHFQSQTVLPSADCTTDNGKAVRTFSLTPLPEFFGIRTTDFEDGPGGLRFPTHS